MRTVALLLGSDRIDWPRVFALGTFVMFLFPLVPRFLRILYIIRSSASPGWDALPAPFFSRLRCLVFPSLVCF